MKNTIKKILGVTLLEVMLVLAIASMIIVMSVRYYQSTNAAQQANSVVTQMISIVVASDTIAQSTGTYMGVTQAAVTALVPKGGMVTPWGTTISVTGSTSTFTTTIPGASADVCPLIISKLTVNPHFTTVTPTTCPVVGTSDVVAIYTSNP